MGVSFQTIVDPFASIDEAPALAERVIQHLIARRIVEAERTDCTLSKQGGYAPGENVAEALATWTPRSTGIPLSLEEIIRDVMRWSCNGVEEVVGRTVFHNFGAGLDAVRCPVCLANEEESNWGDAIGGWFKGDDFASFQCPNCRESSPITEWKFDPPWAFGNLGFKFWDWPPLKRNFIEQISSILGHKVIMIAGKV
jgi:hypothetical protein